MPKTYEYDLDAEYACLSTSRDENICPMRAQFEGNFFSGNDAQELPLCPFCACDYEYYDKREKVKYNNTSQRFRKNDSKDTHS